MSKNSKNIHSATEPEKCREMEQKYGWKLIEVRPTKDKVLKDAIDFEGEQTTFEDNRYGN